MHKKSGQPFFRLREDYESPGDAGIADELFYTADAVCVSIFDRLRPDTAEVAAGCFLRQAEGTALAGKQHLSDRCSGLFIPVCEDTPRRQIVRQAGCRQTTVVPGDLLEDGRLLLQRQPRSAVRLRHRQRADAHLCGRFVHLRREAVRMVCFCSSPGNIAVTERCDVGQNVRTEFCQLVLHGYSLTLSYPIRAA